MVYGPEWYEKQKYPHIPIPYKVSKFVKFSLCIAKWYRKRRSETSPTLVQSLRFCRALSYIVMCKCLYGGVFDMECSEGQVISGQLGFSFPLMNRFIKLVANSQLGF
jgi:hypothetical protein